MTENERFASVWDAIENTPEEAENLKLRSALMMVIERYVHDMKLTQAEAAKVFGVTEQRISDLVRGKVNQFSLDILVTMAGAAEMNHALANALALRAAYIGKRATIELSAMRARLGIAEETAQAAIEHLTAGSENVKAAWIQDGLIIGCEQLAMAWSCSPQAVELACERGELCNLNFRGHNWYPADAASVSAADVGQVTAALQPLDAVSQVIFWARRHGILGGLTVAQAIAAGNLAGVLRMARVLVYESP
jgi:predicted XRE-type DNA-binding protein